MGCKASVHVNAHPPTWAEINSPSDSPYFSQYARATGGAAGDDESKAADGTVGAHWTHDRTAEVPIRYAAKGAASEAVWKARTLCEIFTLAASKKGARAALCVEDVPAILAKGEAPPAAVPLNEWRTLTYGQYFDQCKRAGQAFIHLGLDKFDAVNIYGFNSPQWLMGEMACILAGGIAAGIYPTDTAGQVEYKAKHSGASIAVVENNAKVALFASVAANLPKLKAVVVWAPEGGKKPEDITVGDRTIRVLTWDELVGDVAEEAIKAAAEEGGIDSIASRMDGQKPGNCCSYIYTSGTTGEPKAVMISHDNILWEAQNAASQINGMGIDEAQPDRIISYLPLSHVAGMMVDIVCPLVVTALMPSYTTVYFARPYDLKAGTIGDRLRGVEPTLFLGVPRVWEKIQEKMMATVAANPPVGVKLKIARWAKKRGLQHSLAMQMGGDGSYGCCHNFADKKVLSVVKSRLGLTHCKFAFTGAAPIKTETLEYFGALGIMINEVYGMSECTGATTWSTDEAHKWGSCGWALPGQEVRILDSETGKECPRWDSKSGAKPTEAQQGEVCYRGRHIMMGYMANPELGEEHVALITKKNQEAIDADGWLHSGDKGTMDEDGMVRITGRYKELIIGAGGENIAPVPVEDAVKARCPAISNIMMVGDKRKFNVALVTLKAVGATGDAPGGDELDVVARLVDGVSTISQAVDNKDYVALIQKAIADTNADPNAVASNASKIQKFTILPRDFSVQTGELTPTFKLKRSVAEGFHTAHIDRMYEAKDAYVRYVAGGAGDGGAADVADVTVEA